MPKSSAMQLIRLHFLQKMSYTEFAHDKLNTILVERVCKIDFEAAIQTKQLQKYQKLVGDCRISLFSFFF